MLKLGLIQTLEYKDLTIEDAYVRINSYSGVNKGEMHLIVFVYASLETYHKDKNNFLYDFYEVFTPSTEEGADNFIKQGYDYIKTRPGFEDAIDVIEDVPII